MLSRNSFQQIYKQSRDDLDVWNWSGWILVYEVSRLHILTRLYRETENVPVMPSEHTHKRTCTHTLSETLHDERGQTMSVWDERPASVSCSKPPLWLDDSVMESRTLLSMSRTGLHNLCGSQTLAGADTYAHTHFCFSFSSWSPQGIGSWIER